MGGGPWNIKGFFGVGKRSLAGSESDVVDDIRWSAATVAKNLKHLVSNARVFGIIAAVVIALIINIALLKSQSLDGGERLLAEAQPGDSVLISVTDEERQGVAERASDSDEEGISPDGSDESFAVGLDANDANAMIDGSATSLFKGGWYTVDGARYYLHSDGTKATGTVSIGSANCSFDESGRWLSTYLDVPYTSQYPDMPFGCEVVSVTMMLQHAGLSITKEDIASVLSYSSDPALGFTGSLYYVNANGLGGIVWPQGIANVVYGHIGSVVDLTAHSWETIQRYLDEGKPVCIWITTPALDHTVVLTGYSATEVWVNDPQVGKDVVMQIDLFKSYWRQNGSRALSY